MINIQRVSPVVFKRTAVKTEQRDNWEVVLEYSGEGDGPFLVDLSHKSRFDLQDSNLAGKKPFGVSLPETPGASVFENGMDTWEILLKAADKRLLEAKKNKEQT